MYKKHLAHINALGNFIKVKGRGLVFPNQKLRGFGTVAMKRIAVGSGGRKNPTKSRSIKPIKFNF